MHEASAIRNGLYRFLQKASAQKASAVKATSVNANANAATMTTATTNAVSSAASAASCGVGGGAGGPGGCSGGWCLEGWRLYGTCSATQRIIHESLSDDFNTPRAMRAMVKLKEEGEGYMRYVDALR